jgi:LysB family phage lysis regulatory protein
MLGLNKYLLAALGIVCVTIGLLWWRLDAVAEARDRWKADAESKAAALEVLQAEAARTDAILTELRATRDAIAQDSARTRRALADLEASNEAVRAYLDQPVPADLARLLWPGEDADDPPDAPD